MNDQDSPLSLRVDSGLAIISLSKAHDGNRLDGAMLAALENMLTLVMHEVTVRAIALRSDAAPGGPFCHGMNLDALAASVADFEHEASESTARNQAVACYGRILEMLAFGGKPSIALVQGSVKAGGVGIVAACDFVLASEQASFELTEVFFGLLPANVLPYVCTWRLSPSRAKFYTLSALPMNNVDAVREGLADRCVSTATAETELKNLCKQLWRAEPGALAATKRFFREALEQSGDALRNRARDVLLERMQAPEVAEAMTSLREGASPSWFGRFKPSQPSW